MDALCATPGCERQTTARGFCQTHYDYLHRTGREAPPVQALRSCEFCGGSLAHKKTARAKYCSPLCKDRHATAMDSERLAAARADRECATCGAVFTPATAAGRTCSRACGVTYQNQKRATEKRAELLATRPPCRQCGEDIPAARRGNALFCSPACKKRNTDARWKGEKSQNYQRRFHYGLSAEDYAKMLAGQDNACAICKSTEWGGKSGVPHVDHCHATGKIRGLLCAGCNNGLGHFKDDPVRLEAAATYLRR